MTLDPMGVRSAREMSALLRDARSLLRRADKMFAATAAVDDRVTTGLATEVRTATESSSETASCIAYGEQDARFAHRCDTGALGLRRLLP